MKNESGIAPIEYNVVVKVDAVAETTAGGLHLAETTLSRKTFGETKGVLIATSPMAFTYEDWPDEMALPEIGAHVFFAQNAGVLQKNKVGDSFRIMKDKDVIGYVVEDAA